MQELALYVTLVIVIAILAVFVRVALQSRTAEEYGPVQSTAARIRSWTFWGLVIVGIIVTAVSLRGIPQLAAREAGDVQVVNVTGYQWYWDMDEYVVTAGVPVEFHVTSEDVNHGFGIYDPDLRLVAQVQAMPGYQNVLRHTFERPGIYQILCLEYCGLAHHDMVEPEFEVVAP